VGILVDVATVEIENIHRNLAMKKPMVRAILDGAMQIAVPAFVSTLCICIVFVPIFFLSGTAKYLFQPLAMAVIFAMLASYFLSRTVVPMMVKFLMRGHLEEIDTSLAHGIDESAPNEHNEDFATGRCKEIRRSDRSPAGILGAGVALLKKIILQEFPGQKFDGIVTRTAGALDPASRTMQVEVQVPNHENKLYAGMYGQVKFILPNENAPIVVPANVFLFRTEGPQVATIANANRIHWQKIKVGRDFGTSLEVLDGLTEKPW